MKGGPGPAPQAPRLRGDPATQACSVRTASAGPSSLTSTYKQARNLFYREANTPVSPPCTGQPRCPDPPLYSSESLLMALDSAEPAPRAPTAGPPPAPAALPATLRARPPAPTPRDTEPTKARRMEGGGRGRRRKYLKQERPGLGRSGRWLSTGPREQLRTLYQAPSCDNCRRTAPARRPPAAASGRHRAPLPGGPDDLRALAQACP